MTMIVEDGTGVANANSYTTVAFVQAYFDDRGGNTAWDALATEADQEYILIKATDYIEKRFSEKWIGDKKRTAVKLDKELKARESLGRCISTTRGRESRSW